MRSMSRRNFLKAASAGGVVAGSGLATTLGGFAARAADTSGYRALVCVFLKGGLDCHDTLFPYDTSSYNQYTNIRPTLLSSYQAMDGGSTRERARLLELNPLNAADYGSRAFALPEEFSGIHNLFESGHASIASNVGPLIRPMDRNTYNTSSSDRPSKLFSHNDQQSTWMALAPEGVRFGWGGRFADAALGSNANANPVFTSISVSGNEVFLSGETAFQYQLDSKGAQVVNALENANLLGSGRDSSLALSLLDEHLRDGASGSLFQQDVASVTARAIDSNALFNDTLEAAAPLATAFPNSGLGSKLSRVAKAIAARGPLGASRQVFYVDTGGFDTHSNQARSLPGLQRQIDEAVSAFYAATEELGVENDVTLFTASDFGRTLIINGDGTDHGWGGHHLIVGGAVNGQRIFGDVPPPTVDHSQDSGRGRLIPTMSVEQFAAPLGRWFGLSEGELLTALPRLSNFSSAPLIV
ncbi:MAG: DUF1501 domain-containing protein [Pseudomonadota bacterium]